MNGAGTVPEPGKQPGPGRSDDPYAILKNRDFLFFMVGRFIASFGQQMLAGAVGWEIYERTHSALDLGYVGLVQMLPMFLFTLHAGHVADNHNRKKVVLWMQLVLGVTFAALTLVSMFNVDVLWMYCCLFVFGTARTYLWAATSSFMPQLVSRAEFSRAVTWNSGSYQISAAAGPAVGGALISATHHAWLVYAFNVVAALVCFILVASVRAHHKVAAKERMSLKNVMAGLHYVYRTKVVLGSITLDMFAVLLGGATAMLPVYAKDILHVSAGGLGWLQASLPLGSLLMSIVLVHRPPLQKAGQTLLWSVIGFGLATIGFGYSRIFWLSFVLLFLCGVTDYISVVVRHTLVQLLTPDEMRGRVSAINSLFIGTSNQMGEFESGIVAHYTSPVFAVVSGGVGTIAVVILAAIAWPELRKYGRLDS
jgi:MFS family permease